MRCAKQNITHITWSQNDRCAVYRRWHTWNVVIGRCANYRNDTQQNVAILDRYDIYCRWHTAKCTHAATVPSTEDDTQQMLQWDRCATYRRWHTSNVVMGLVCYLLKMTHSKYCHGADVLSPAWRWHTSNIVMRQGVLSRAYWRWHTSNVIMGLVCYLLKMTHSKYYHGLVCYPLKMTHIKYCHGPDVLSTEDDTHQM